MVALLLMVLPVQGVDRFSLKGHSPKPRDREKGGTRERGEVHGDRKEQEGACVIQARGDDLENSFFSFMRSLRRLYLSVRATFPARNI